MTVVYSATDGDECREPIPSQLCPVGPNNAPLNGTRKRQYRGNSQASVWGTDIQRPRIYQDAGCVLGTGRGGQEQ